MSHDQTGLLTPFRRDRKRDFASGSGGDLLASKVLQALMTNGATPRSSGQPASLAYYKRNLDIVQQDHDGTTLRRWSLSRAWPVKLVAGDWDNEADENVIESVTLSYDFLSIRERP